MEIPVGRRCPTLGRGAKVTAQQQPQAQSLTVAITVPAPSYVPSPQLMMRHTQPRSIQSAPQDTPLAFRAQNGRI
jgi:hypothetical protein